MIVRILANNKVSVIDIPPDKEDEFLALNKSKNYKKVDSLPESMYDCYKYDPQTDKIVVDQECEIQNLKQDLIKHAKGIVQSYILEYYPLEKQNADDQQKDYYGNAILLIRKQNNQQLSLNDIYITVAENVNKIRFNNASLDDIVKQFPENEQYYWEQLIKAGLRKAWVIECVYIFNSFKKQVESTNDIQTLKDMFAKDLELPKFPL